MSRQLSSYQLDMVLGELIDIVGRQDVSTATPDRFIYAVDHYWVPEMWVDKGEQPILPDFVVQVDDGREAPLNLVVEVKGFRGEDAKQKKETMDTFWVPGVNNLGTHGRWAFVELRDVFDMQEEFARLVQSGRLNQST